MPKTFTILLFFFLYSSFLYTQSEEPSVLTKNGEISSIKLEEAVWRNVDATPILQDSFGRIWFELDDPVRRIAYYDGSSFVPVYDYKHEQLNTLQASKGLMYFLDEPLYPNKNHRTHVSVFDPLKEAIVDSIFFTKAFPEDYFVYRLAFSESEDHSLIWAQCCDNHEGPCLLYLSKDHHDFVPFLPSSQTPPSPFVIVEDGNYRIKTPIEDTTGYELYSTTYLKFKLRQNWIKNGNKGLDTDYGLASIIDQTNITWLEGNILLKNHTLFPEIFHFIELDSFYKQLSDGQLFSPNDYLHKDILKGIPDSLTHIIYPKTFRSFLERPSKGTFLSFSSYKDDCIIIETDTNRVYQNHLFIPGIKQITSVWEDTSENIWIGGEDGLSKFRIQNQKIVDFVSYDIASNTSYISNKVNSILADEDDRYLWLGTRQGLYKFDKTTGISMNMGVLADRAAAIQFNARTYRDTISGDMYFRIDGNIGLVKDEQSNVEKYNTVAYYCFLRFNPQKLSAAVLEGTPQLPIFYKRLTKYSPKQNKEVIWPESNINKLDRLELQAGERYFSLEYLLADYREPDDVFYTHYLEGYDKIWSIPAKKANKVRYENLPPGTYTLKLKASLFKNCVLPDGNCKERQLTIIQLPFWYQTWWAKMLYIISFIFLIYAIYRILLYRQAEKAKRLEEMDNLKTRLYTNITHEFRTPLTVILGLTQKLSENSKGKASEYLNMIRRNGQQLLRLINQMLDLAKLESGELQLQFFQADIIPFILYVSESFQSLAETQKIQLTSYSEIQSLQMDFDPGKMQDIISNLLSNAIKFTPEGGKVILHLTKGKKEEQPYLQIKVTDTGIGIPADHLPNIFDRFYQIDHSNTRKAEGSGIGLAFTKELVQQMDGQIEVQSTEEEGTVFSIQIPITQMATIQTSKVVQEQLGAKITAAKQEEIAYIKSNEKAITIGQGQKYNVLIIEDNKDVTSYIQSCLEGDYEITSAANGQLGIEKALEQIPDLIISDVMMPEKDGYEVCSALKSDERTSHIPIVLLTAKATQKDKLTGLQTGADAYLIKPFDKEELLIRIEKLIALRKQLQARYAMLQPPKNDKSAPKEDAFVLKLRKVVEDKMDDPNLGVVHLCKVANLSHMQVYRKLKALTNRTPSQFIRSIRLQKAFELLKSTDLTVAEVAYDVGFSDPNYFSRVFLEEFGLRPSVMRK